MNNIIDPQWAWSEYKANDESPWNIRSAAHLYRRAGFGATHQELEIATGKDPVAVVDEIFAAKEPSSFLSEMKSLADGAIASGNVRQLSAWWSYRMLHTPAQLLEKITLFWHGHFATSAEKVTQAKLMLTQNELLRSFAIGDFSELVMKVSHDPAMLIYLDSATNRKAHPNENFAREIMELFCLGEGNYTENDIRELARCFTGWEIRRDEFRFNPYQHDAGNKIIFGQTGEFSGEDGVKLVLDQKATPEFVVSKLIRFFVMDEPVADEALVAPLAKQFRSDGMSIEPVLKRILKSNLFFSSYATGRKVRSPVELAIGLLRCLEGSTNTFALGEAMQTLGQGLMYPPSVKGWDGGRTWINSSTLLGRSNLIRSLITGENTRFGKQSLQDYFVSKKLYSSRSIIDYMEAVAFAVPISNQAKDRIELLMKPDSQSSLAEGFHALCTLPEFQLG